VAGYTVCSLDSDVFEQLTTSPTREHSLILADAVLDGLDVGLQDYKGDKAADPEKWPLDRELLATFIQERLASADWYADFTMGDASIWDNCLLRALMDESGEQLGIDFRIENDGFLYWDAAEAAAEHGAPMMSEPKFGNSGFRYSGKSRTELELLYTIHLPADVQELLHQLETAVPYFETLPDDDDGDRVQFFDGLLDPVRSIAKAGRVIWVQTDT